MTKDEQLLTAAFAVGDRAREAWVAWRDSVDVEVLEPAEEKVLPQLYRNLSGMGVTDPVVERLRSTYRHTWVANQLLLQGVAEAMAVLAREGVDARLIGDAALVLALALVAQASGRGRVAEVLAAVPTLPSPLVAAVALLLAVAA
ncbi:MAG: hypothetical protein JOZ25_08470, partial [Actinobacteria bacterium]|nr:hypothetical protein [Actinomycetota bacterium]